VDRGIIRDVGPHEESVVINEGRQSHVHPYEGCVDRTQGSKARVTQLLVSGMVRAESARGLEHSAGPAPGARREQLEESIRPGARTVTDMTGRSAETVHRSAVTDSFGVYKNP
jgi:hypothetical protein